MPDRMTQIQQWLSQVLGVAGVTLTPASADASFRRYFRVQAPDAPSRILMDAPPDRETTAPFVKIAKLLAGMGVSAPRILAEDAGQGFLLLTDMGDTQYAQVLNEQNVDALYTDAFAALMRLQTAKPDSYRDLPLYDEALLLRELGIFREWLLENYLGLKLSAEQDAMYFQVCQVLIRNALEQPRVFVHRDYHSRNLMVLEQDNPGILDFQDAVVGPVTYDLVSLLRDCYVAWPPAQVQQWARVYWQRLGDAGVINVPWEVFRRWFDLMGMQRHLKAAGIFTRLQQRDGKDGYIKDIPRTLAYVMQVCKSYPEFAVFAGFLAGRVLPAFEEDAA